jgi:hypothetical protein
VTLHVAELPTGSGVTELNTVAVSTVEIAHTAGVDVVYVIGKPDLVVALNVVDAPPM